MGYQAVADDIASSITPGPRVCILGSEAFRSKIGPSLCTVLGKSLAKEGFVLVTDGNYNRKAPTIQQQVATAFYDSHVASNSGPAGALKVYHICPQKGTKWVQWPFGEVLIAGQTREDGGEILARICTAYVMVEGRKGTAHIGQVVLS